MGSSARYAPTASRRCVRSPSMPTQRLPSSFAPDRGARRRWLPVAPHPKTHLIKNFSGQTDVGPADLGGCGLGSVGARRHGARLPAGSRKSRAILLFDGCRLGRGRRSSQWNGSLNRSELEVQFLEAPEQKGAVPFEPTSACRTVLGL